MPAHALPKVRPATERALRQQVRADLDSTLRDSVGDDERFDRYLAGALLDALVSGPGDILNVAGIANQLQRDRRTVERYLEVLQRRFLVHSLPNLASRPRTQRGGRLKVFPVDTAISAESLHRAGNPIGDHPEKRGQMLEAMVVNELLAHQGWSELEPEVFYWRDRADVEVDLVILDSTGRRVGIEVKAAVALGPRDLRGLRDLASNGGLHRGFVVYRGSEVVQLDTFIWALPVSFLGGGPSLVPPGPTTRALTPRQEPPMPGTGADEPAATLFVSYAHVDDAYGDGAVLHFAGRLVEAYRVLYGDALSLFVDRDDIRWGAEWRHSLRTGLEQNTFLLAFISPSYLRSEHCQHELLSFSQIADAAEAGKLVLPLIWTPVLDLGTRADPVADVVRRRQHIDISDVRLAEPSSREFRRKVEDVARQLHLVITSRETTEDLGDPALETPPPEDDEAGDDLLELFEQLEDLTEAFRARTSRWVGALEDFGAAFGGGSNRPQHRCPLDR